MLKNSAWKPIWTTLFPLSILFIIIALLLTSMARSGDAREDGRSFSNPERPDIPYKTTSEDRLQFASRSSQPSGLIAIHAKSGPMISTTESSWMDIPQMRGRVTIKEFSSLAVTFCAETAVSADKRLFVRALLNGQPADPSDVVFAYSNKLDTNCFVFVKENLPPDLYAVRVQWLVDSGGTGSLGDRTLTIAYAVPDAPEMRLLAHAAPSGPEISHNGGWTTISDMQGLIEMPAAGDLAITFTGEAYVTDGKRLFVRALVDGQPADASDQVLTIGALRGVRTMHFTKKGVSAGAHQVEVQWHVDSGGTGFLGDRTVSVVGIPSVTNRQAAALFVSAPSGPAEVIPSKDSWYDIPNLSGTIDVPVEGDLAIQFSGETYVDNDTVMGVRALVDGVPASPSDVHFASSTSWYSYGYTFVKRQVARGAHQIRLQWLLNGSGNIYLGDRTMAVYHTAEQVPVLFVAMESDRGAADYEYGGYFDAAVVQEVGGIRQFRGYVRDRLAGEAPSVADYYRENSDDRYFLVEAAVLGPYLKKYNEKYYREQIPNPFTEMKLEALSKADQYFDFSLYDHDGDGIVSREELLVNIIFYQDTHFGEVRNIPDYSTSDSVTLSGLAIATVYTPDFDQTEEIGLFSHELAHAGFNAGDMYESGWEPTAPGPYSLMDQHYYHPHLDPLHKIRAADWFDPITVPKDGYYEIGAVENWPQIYKLHDPASHSGEYFLVENRENLGYDAYLPDNGLAIWHIDETVSPSDFYRNAVEIEPASGLVNPVPWDTYLFDGEGHYWGQEFTNTTSQINSKWHDGSFSQIGLYAISPGNDVMSAYFDVPGPGILVDVMPEVGKGDKTVVFEVRLVNTGNAADTFSLSSTLPGGWVDWSENPVTLNSYEERVVTLMVSPNWSASDTINFQVSGQSNSNPGVLTEHWATLQKGASVHQVNLPMIIR